MEMLLFFSLVNQPLLASDFFSAACLTSLVFIELKRVRASLWNRLWLKEILRLVCSSIQTTTNFSTSLITFFSLVSFGCSLEQHFSFPSGPFPLHSQFGYLVRKAYLSVYLGFWCAFLSLIISTFWLGGRGVTFHLNTYRPLKGS